MAGQIKPVGVQQVDGEVQGTFDLVREGKPAVRFSCTIPPNATPVEIGQSLLAECQRIISQEPPAALTVLSTMVKQGQFWTLPDAPPAE